MSPSGSQGWCLRWQYAELELSEGHLEAAADLLRRALRLRRRDAGLVAMLATTRTLLGASDDEVVPMYREALEWQPDQPVAALNLAQILLRRDSASEEARHLLHAMDQANLDSVMRLERLFYGATYAIEGFDDAPREIRRLLNAGVRVTAWDLSREIEWAQTRGHLHAGLLAQVAEA